MPSIGAIFAQGSNMNTGNINFTTIVLLTLLLYLPFISWASMPENKLEVKRPQLVSYINEHCAEQLTDPHKKKRRSFSQFGYNLSFFQYELFPIVEFTDVDHLGTHSYGKPGSDEKNGVIYTCKGGFLDVSHIRAAADWTVHLAFKILHDNCDFELPDESGKLSARFTNLQELSLEDVIAMAQKMAHERLLWHEIVSWHYHGPNRMNSEQQSAFTPEDIYSNLVGTEVGKNIAMRMLLTQEQLPYETIATEEIKKAILQLHPLSIEACKKAYDMVDRYRQQQLPPEERNTDVWWDSNIIFRDQRYVFKRYMHVGPVLEPWLVPNAEKIGCPCNNNTVADNTTGYPVSQEQALLVPQVSTTGKSFYQYYQFTIEPDDILFFNKNTGALLHPVFSAFTTNNIAEIVGWVGNEIETTLMPGFDRRDHNDPVPSFGKVKRVADGNQFPFWPRETR